MFGGNRVSSVALALCFASGWQVSTARADEPRKATEPILLAEPGELTQVVDAFDEHDPFDLHLSLGYQQTFERASIRRETSIAAPGLTTGGYVSDALNVARYTRHVSRLNTRADIGLFRDVALILRLPIILSDNRRLESLEGSAAQQALVLQGTPGEQLFTIPFEAPNRSGIEYLAVGLDVAIFNQFRDPSKPTWLVGVETRFSVAEPQRACNGKPGGPNGLSAQVQCAHPSDINRNGRSQSEDGTPEFPNEASGASLEGNFSGEREAGVSRGTTAIEAHTYVSKRIKLVEPYGGFRFLFEFPNETSDYGSGDAKGALSNHPPAEGSFITGVHLIPWEVRDAFQRVTLDLRFTSTYRSEGRDYSELYDALGSSDARSLRNPTFSEYQANPDAGTRASAPSVVDPTSQRVYFTGLTDVQQHAKFTFSGQFTWQAGEYIKFNLGGAFTAVQSHLLSMDQPCDPELVVDVAKSGTCRTSSQGEDRVRFTATGHPNPNYRAVIDTPGRRFKVADASTFDAWISATVMF